MLVWCLTFSSSADLDIQAKAESSSSSSSSSESESEEEKKPAPKATPKATPKGKAAAKAASSSSESSDESSSEEEEPKKAAPKAAEKPATSSSESSEDESSEDEKPKAAQVKAAPTKKTSDSDSDSDSDSSSEDEAPKKAAAAKKASPAKPAATKAAAKKAESSSSEESDSDSDDEDEKPAAKKAESSSSDESSSDDEDVEMADASAKPTTGKRKAEDDTAQTAKKAKVEPAAEDSGETKTVFVGRLSWNVDNDWLASEFAECGEVTSARVQMDRNTGKSRGFGYVTFATAEAVEKALALTGKEIDGRPINVDKSIEKDQSAVREKRAKAFGDTPSAPSSVLFVGNLSFDASEDMLWEAFSEYGSVKSVRMPTDRESGRPKGFGYVEFEDIESAKKAHEGLVGQEIAGRAIRLDFSQPRDDSNGGGRGGFGGRGGGRGGRGGFGGDRGGRGGFGGDRGGRGGFGGRGGGRVSTHTLFILTCR